MKCNVVEQIQGLLLGWLTPGWDARNTAFILCELMIIMRSPAPPPPTHPPCHSPSLPLTHSGNFCFVFPLTLPLFAVDCVDPQCGGHGVCVRGECVCSAGWAGVSCDDPLPACQEQCSGHGTYLPESDTCTCQPNWTGPDCYTGKARGLVHIQTGGGGLKHTSQVFQNSCRAWLLTDIISCGCDRNECEIRTGATF